MSIALRSWLPYKLSADILIIRSFAGSVADWSLALIKRHLEFLSTVDMAVDNMVQLMVNNDMMANPYAQICVYALLVNKVQMISNTLPM